MRASVEISFGKPATANGSAECSPFRLLLTATLRQVALGSGLTLLGGYPFEVRYSEGALVRACAAADVAASAYGYFSRLFSGVEPDIAVIVADQADWEEQATIRLPFFNDDDGL